MQKKKKKRKKNQIKSKKHKSFVHTDRLLITLEELEAKLDRFIANSDETARENLRKSYEAFKNGTKPNPPPIVEPEKPVKTVDPLQKGISGLKGFEVKSIEPNNNNGKNAFDRKRSTAFEGKSLTAGIGGAGLIKGIGVKFKGGPLYI